MHQINKRKKKNYQFNKKHPTKMQLQIKIKTLTPGVLQFLPAELPSHPMPEAIPGDQGDEPGLGSSTNTHTSTGFMLCASHDGRY